ncbi:TIGR03564 family F420-dependent LLM class oxidoreductase [Streptomyces termitum]|uniref:TIGR03564 family F420-dependent LLM class oxidoreductase n=1 Tax=Streptomyces termitum TaxID=67368 RepID=UPI00382141D0
MTLSSSTLTLPVDTLVELAHEARDAGLHSAWFGQTFGYDSPSLAALVGREVPGLHVGTSAIPVFGRHPLLVSSQAQTAQAATAGRYHLGLALGRVRKLPPGPRRPARSPRGGTPSRTGRDPQYIQYGGSRPARREHAPDAAGRALRAHGRTFRTRPGTRHLTETGFGLPYQRPIALLREFLTALRPLLDTGEADFHGELLTATTPLPAAVPGARPPVPVLVAAMGPQALRVSGELADGILPFLAGPRALAEHIVPAVTGAARAAGRPAPRIVALVPGAVTADPEAARRRAADVLGFYETIPSYRRALALSGVDRAADLAVLGDEEAVAAEVRRYTDAGATEVVFTATDLGGEADRRRTWSLLGELSRARSAAPPA